MTDEKTTSGNNPNDPGEVSPAGGEPARGEQSSAPDSKKRRWRIAIAAVFVVLLAILGGGYIYLDATLPRPSARGYELEVVNAMLFLPEFEPSKKSTSELNPTEMQKILGKKNAESLEMQSITVS